MVSRAVRCTAIWLITTLLLLTIGWLALGNIDDARTSLRAETLPGQSFETLFLWLCSALLIASCIWLWLTTTVVVSAIARGQLGTRVRGCPEFVRRGLLAACGVAIAGSFALPAHASPGLGDDATHPSSAVSPQVVGLPLPDRTADGTAAVHLPVTPVSSATVDTTPVVTVREGDTLWALAADTLDRGASPAAIAERVEQLHQLNRDVVGSDPDRIYPGQELRLPGGDH